MNTFSAELIDSCEPAYPTDINGKTGITGLFDQFLSDARHLNP